MSQNAISNSSATLQTIQAHGVVVALSGGQLKIAGDLQVVPASLLAQLREQKTGIIAQLQAEQPPPAARGDESGPEKDGAATLTGYRYGELLAELAALKAIRAATGVSLPDGVKPPPALIAGLKQWAAWLAEDFPADEPITTLNGKYDPERLEAQLASR